MSLWLAGRISPQGHGERHQPGERHGDLRLRRGTPGRKGRKRIEKTHQPELSDLFPDGSFLGGGLPIGRQRAGPGNALPDAHGGRQRKPDRDPLRAGGRGGDVRFQRITRIDDARWTTGSNGTYPFTYNGDAIPHLTAIANDIHTAEKYTSLTRATRRSTIRSTTGRSPPRRCCNPCRLRG